jgi:hypothetical protein
MVAATTFDGSLDGATEADIHAIKQAMEKRSVVRAAIPGKSPSDSSLSIDSQKKWRRGWDSNPRKRR